MLEWIIIASAGFAGGLLNAVAGGGSFFTLPALMYAGLPPVMANATGTAALLPGYLASVWRFRRNIEFPAGLSLLQVILISAMGGGLGAGILLLSSDATFRALVPWLVLFATIMFAAGPALLQRLAAHRDQHSPHFITVVLILGAVCAYGGYFNGAVGIVLLAALGLLGQTDLRGMNGAKNLVSAILTALAVVLYVAGGLVALDRLLVMGLAAIAGGYAGAAFAYRLSQKVLRMIVIASGLLLFVAFLLLDA